MPNDTAVPGEPRVGVGVIVRRGEEVLLMRRRGSHGAGSWSPPGGHLDFGESLEGCAARECLEETGVEVTGLRCRAITNDLFEDEGRHYLTVWMEGEILRGEPRLNSPGEMSEVRWFPWSGLPEPLFQPFANLLDGRLQAVALGISMSEAHDLLRHHLATLAYRTQKAIRGAPSDFARFTPGNNVRTPHAVLCHMTSVLGYARSRLVGGTFEIEPCSTWTEEVSRFHALLEDLSRLLARDEAAVGVDLPRLLQGPLSDAMTHVGQLAMLRRLAGHPVEPENFMKAGIDPENLGQDQPVPASPGRRDGSGADPI